MDSKASSPPAGVAPSKNGFVIARAILIYAIVILFFSLFHYRQQIINLFYDPILFYFDSTYSDFKLWFPRLYLFAYGAVCVAKLGITALPLFLIYLAYKNRQKIWYFLNYNQQPFGKKFILNEVLLSSAFFAIGIAIYYILKQLRIPDFFEVQRLLVRCLLLLLSLQYILVFLLKRVQIINKLKLFLLEPTSPVNIAILRIFLSIYLIFIYLIFLKEHIQTVDLSKRASLPFIGWLMNITPINSNLYSGAVIVGCICCLFIALGLFTRLFLILNAFFCYYIISSPNYFGKVYHYQLFIWIPWIFTFSRCYDVFSIDSWLKKIKPTLSPNYSFPIKLIWLQFGIIYFWAGFYKLWDGGFDWALGNSMINQVRLEWVQNYDKLPFFRIDNYPTFLHIGGMAVILFELGYMFLILQHSLRWIAALGGLFMHNAIGLFMNIFFFLELQTFYIFYIDFSKFFKKNIRKINYSYSKPALFFGLFILSMNFLCGMFSIHTYPFSAYPKYSAIIDDRLKVLEYKCNNLNQSTFEIGKSNGFRWESYGWLEYNLIKDYEAGQNVNQRILGYWETWKTHNPQLQNCDTVFTTIKERSLIPEEKNIVFSQKRIGYIYKDSFFLIQK